MKTKASLIFHVQNLSWACCKKSVHVLIINHCWQLQCFPVSHLHGTTLELNSEAIAPAWRETREENTQKKLWICMFPASCEQENKCNWTWQRWGKLAAGKGEKVQFKEKVGCKNRNLVVHLCSGFVMGKVTRICGFFKHQTLLATDCSVSLIIGHLGNTWGWKSVGRCAYINTESNKHEYKETSPFLLRALLDGLQGNWPIRRPVGEKLLWPKPAQGAVSTCAWRETLQRNSLCSVLCWKALCGLRDDMSFYGNPDFKLATDGKLGDTIIPKRK